jgi:maleylpyruvate isomerase
VGHAGAMTDPGIETAILAVADAYEHVLGSVATLTDDQARGPSRLPGWTRGHVLTHLARNADGNRNLVEGAIAGEERDQYPGGAARRVGDIEAGAARDARALVADFESSHQAMADVWRQAPDAAWAATGIWLMAGRQPIRACLSTRRRELLVHWIDLDLGTSPVDLPADYVADDGEWLREHRTRAAWPDAPWGSPGGR